MGHDDVLAQGGTKAHNSYFKAYLDSEALVTVLPQNVLLDMGQGALKVYFNNEDGHSDWLQQLSRIWQNLLNTTRSTAVTDSHLTAACNAMCVFLECACSSVMPYVRTFGMSKQTWLQCFEAILESFEEGKVKPMRQVLTTLANILTHQPDHVVSSSIQNEVMAKMAGIILLGEAGHMKAALIALELFIRRVASFEDVLKSLKYCVQDKQMEWSRRLVSFGVKKAIDDLPIPASMSSVAATESEFHTTITFVVALLMALLSRDTQSAAIALYKTYSTALIGSGRGNHLYSVSTSKQEEISEVGTEHNLKRANQSPWIPLVQAFLEAYPTAATPFADFLFPAIFKHDPTSYKEYADSFQKSSCSLSNLLAVVQVGCHIGLERDPGSTLNRIIQGIDVHSEQAYDIYGLLLAHAGPDVRIRTFALLLASSSTTTPLHNAVLQCLTSHMKYLYGDSDPQNRSEVMSIIRKLVIRLQGGAWSLHKYMANQPSQSSEKEAENSCNSLCQHERFLVSFVKFLEDELRPNVSYQRHIMALNSLEYLVRSGLDGTIAQALSTEIGRNQTPWPFNVSLHHGSLTCALLNLLMDPFEDVRAASSMLLDIFGSTVAVPMQRPVCELVWKAEELASRTSRADHADGAARLYKLYYTLMPDSSIPTVLSPLPSKRAVIEEILLPAEKALAEIEGNLDVPLQQISLHARLLALRYLLQDRKSPVDIYEDEASKTRNGETLTGRMIFLCQQVWEKVRGRLCVDSPENAESDVGDEVIAGPKDILSYSWRGLRDSSLLLCAILGSPIFKERDAMSLSKLKALEAMGHLCIDQLSNLRHRGAFSTVAQTFSVLCERIAESNDNAASRLREMWYESAVTTLNHQATRLTRRSAGLPAMMLGLLTGCSRAFFNRFIDSFKERARNLNNFSKLVWENDDQQIELPQVHALNCLREVFTNARFRTITEPHVLDMLDLAASSLSCDIWAIRNCGLMLFRACTRRLGRARISPPTIHDASQLWTSEVTVSNDRAPDILGVAMNLLDSKWFSRIGAEIPVALQSKHQPFVYNDEATHPVATERIFAALDMIGRISPSFHDADYIERLVLGKLSSQVWQVREQAARVLAPRVSPWDAFDVLGRLVDGMATGKDQNMAHGRLLCVKQILRNMWRSQTEPLRHHLERAAALLHPLVAPIMANDMSIVVRTTFLDIMNDAFEMEILSRISEDDLRKISCSIGEDVLQRSGFSDGPDSPKHESAALHVAYTFFASQSGPGRDPQANPKLRTLFLNLAKCDFDAAARFLGHLTSQDSWNQKIRNLLDNLFEFIITDNFFPEDLRSGAIAGLSASIELKKFDPEAISSLTEIHQCLLHDSEPQGRDLRNAKLRLQANLFSLGNQEALTQTCIDTQSQLASWIVMLQDAAWDDIDTPTRFDAASSLLAFTPVLILDQNAALYPSYYLQICLLLYDLLNDDDDDVREIAASAASRLLPFEENVSRTLVDQSPRAASEKLALFLGDKFGHESYFTSATLNRIWFSSSSAEKRESAKQDIRDCSVKVLLESFKKTSNALFEEERQNLYIDDVREVEIWSYVLKSIEPPEEEYLNSLGDWVLTALQDLSDYLDEKVNFDGPLGLTSQADTLILFLRVTELAGVTLHWANWQPDQVQDPPINGAPDKVSPFTPTDRHVSLDEALPARSWTAGILLGLKAIEETGRRVCIHERIMRSIEEIINKNLTEPFHARVNKHVVIDGKEPEVSAASP